jgi:hypothetical protein
MTQILCGLKGEYRYFIEDDTLDQGALSVDWTIPETEVES